MTTAQHTPGPWEVIGNLVRSPMAQLNDEEQRPAGMILADCRDGYGLSQSNEAKANACLMGAALELLAELEKAHIIIRNALNLMTTAEQLLWGESNYIDDVEGEGITRANERAAVIRRAKGGGGHA